MKKPVRITAPLNTTGLVDVVAADLDISQAQAHDAVMAVFGAITRATASGHKVAITNFGTWLPSRAKPRIFRNPQTGEAITVEAHQVVRFRVSPGLADAVRRRDRHADIRKQPRSTKTPAAAATPTAE
ncbi:HU family DNA-binding protein [Streptomyces sp. STR69]|uniref:HU family DNA-binding protein n=1 Tax=Streptomyces sp. STR69 TaxID=1796942 RepID=UPI0021CA827B|nr:HU family DNA-binding protein [Streptomyces sp. STR69]